MDREALRKDKNLTKPTQFPAHPEGNVEGDGGPTVVWVLPARGAAWMASEQHGAVWTADRVTSVSLL